MGETLEYLEQCAEGEELADFTDYDMAYEDSLPRTPQKKKELEK